MRKNGTIPILLMILTASPLFAKEIIPDAAQLKSENQATIRTDGLACYFCAYGLERFFKKTGKIAAFDIDMEKGLVMVTFIKGKEVVPFEELRKYVDDAGFSPRWIEYSLMGQFSREPSPHFQIEASGQRWSVVTQGAPPQGKVRVRLRVSEGETVLIVKQIDLLEKL